MLFDFKYTCTEIDNNIEQMESEVEDHILDLVLDLNPMLKYLCNIPDDIQVEIREYQNSLIDPIKDLFENLRSLNEEMRGSAEHQLKELTTIIEDLEYDNQELKRELEESHNG